MHQQGDITNITAKITDINRSKKFLNIACEFS
jgi:hypothetical protein